jgi:hypothetical protein
VLAFDVVIRDLADDNAALEAYVVELIAQNGVLREALSEALALLYGQSVQAEDKAA